MQIIFWLLFGIMIVVIIAGGYYQLQIFSRLKPGKGVSVFTGGWVFHPEYLEQEGRLYRKKLFLCYVAFFFLIVVISIVSRIIRDAQ